MNNVIITTIKTWACANCGYKQSHDPADIGEMNATFSEPRYAGRPDGACPACYAGENPQRQRDIHHLESISGSDLGNLGQKTVASDETLEATEVEETDERGNVAMVQTGERYELRVNQQSGEIYSEAVPVMEPKMRSLTPRELSDLKEQRNRSLDELEKAAVKEISEPSPSDDAHTERRT